VAASSRESAAAGPVIAVVVDDAQTRAALTADLMRRYAADFDVVELSSAGAESELSATEDLAARHLHR
jgi:hypothetical protein